MATHAHTTPERRPEAAPTAPGRRSLFGGAAALALAAAPNFAFAAPTNELTETAAERALWRCMGVVAQHQATIARLASQSASDAAIKAIRDRINAELEIAAETAPDTRQAFALKARIVHQHGHQGFPAGVRVQRTLIANLMGVGIAIGSA